MQPDPRLTSWEALEAARAVERFVQGITREDFAADELVVAAVERKLAVIGEALVRLSKSHADLASGISDLRQIIGLRNVLVHGYDVVDVDVVWRIVEHDVPVLIVEIEQLLTELES